MAFSVKRPRVLGMALLSSAIFAHSQTVPAKQWISTIPNCVLLGAAAGPDGRIFLIGTADTGFPVTANALQPTLTNILDPAGIFAILDPSGSTALYATYLNGLVPHKIVVDQNGSAYILSEHDEPVLPTESFSDYSIPFPISTNAAQTFPAALSTHILAKFSSTGQLIFSTYLGGSSPDPTFYFFGAHFGGMAVDANGAVTVCGSTQGNDMLVTAGAFQSSNAGYWNAYIARVSPDGTAFQALTYLGGANIDFCEDVKLDSSGNVYVFGDASSRFFPVTSGAYQTQIGDTGSLFVSKFDADLRTLSWSTLLPGNLAQFMAINPDASVTLAGIVDVVTTPELAPNFLPYWGPTLQPFVAMLDPTGSKMLFSQTMELISGAPVVSGWVGMAPDGAGHVFIVGGTGTYSVIPLFSLNAIDTGNGPPENGVGAFLLRFDSGVQQISYFGPLVDINMNPAGVAVAGTGNIVVAGQAFANYSDPGVPVHAIAPGAGGAVVSLDFSGEQTPLLTQAVNPASLSLAGVSAGQVVELHGLGLGPATAVQYTPDATGVPPLLLAGTQVYINSAPVPVISAQYSIVRAWVPSTFSTGSTWTLSVGRNGVMSNVGQVASVAANPGLFTLSGNSGEALALGTDGVQNSPTHPVQRGGTIRLIATGLGSAEGITAILAELSATVTGVSPASGYPPGYFMVDVVIPSGAPASDFVLVHIANGGQSSQEGVTISVR